MKKNDNFSILNRNKKKATVATGRQPKYIYTEADLGEGILDAGVPIPYKTTSQETKVGISSLAAVTISNARMKMPNVGEDFNYAYYY